MTARGPLRPPPADRAPILRQRFADAGYTESGLLKVFGVVEPPMPHLRNLPRLLDLTREPTVQNTLIRWFLLGLPVEEDLGRRVLPGPFLAACLESGLLAVEANALVPAVLLVPVGPHLVASDLYQRLLSSSDFDHVLTINPPARLLMDFTVRRPARATLDLCSGSGVQALAAAAHSDAVFATDLNPRATAFAAFSAALNGCDRVTCLTGDGFAPVAGSRFDLIVCNPPFILAPSKRYLYRDSGVELDGFCRSLVRQAPAHLEEGGYFQMIFEWVELEGQPWQERLSSWFQDTECDAWLLANYTHDPSWYAHTRLRETPFRSAQADSGTYTEWVEYYRRHKVEAIHGGLVAMRRAAGGNWLRIDELPDRVAPGLGRSVLQAFEGRDLLRRHDSEASLLAARLRIAPDAGLEQESGWSAGQWIPQAIRIRHTQGLPQVTGLSPDVAGFLARFDGVRPVGQVVEEVVAVADAEPSRARQECLRVVRLMIDRGFLQA